MSPPHPIHAGLFALAATIAPCALAQQPPAPPAVVEVAAVTLAQIAPRRWVPGSVVSRDDARLATSAAGRVEYVAEVGTVLKTGDRVAQLEGEAIRLRLEDARSEVVRIRAQRELAERQGERLAKLAANRSIAANQLDEAKAEVAQLGAQLRQAEVRVRSVQYELDQTVVHAPFPGVVSERMVQRGEYVATGAAIVHLVDTSNLEARVQAPLSLAAALRPGMELDVRAGAAATTTRGQVRAIVPVGEERSRQFELRMSLDGASLLVGSAVEVALPEREATSTVAVPRDAIVTRAEGSHVVRVAADGSSERVEVRVGASDAGLIAVEGDLQAGERVVVRGAERLAPGQKVQAAAHGEIIAGVISTAARPPG
jgi:RND family efflux transporter MFP subunit